ncbi:hypothetical protein HPB50_009123 [Hyalomma asiaticum]|uniref:Uncharacterized protein n=1 Tax=Hyalomma asiaticum TaxID=266040 RepID=A0ACB7RID1_HYAAI|nr:hypothetical protein HPB50_009123 [Hyalomma asiaticum]
MAEESSHGNTPPSLKNIDKEPNTGGEASDDDSDTPLDLTWTSVWFDSAQSPKSWKGSYGLVFRAGDCPDVARLGAADLRKGLRQ